MQKNYFTHILATVAAFLIIFSGTTTTAFAQLNGGGPYGDIDGYYTWEIDRYGRTVYSQNGYDWIYDNYGNRTYISTPGSVPAPSQSGKDLTVSYQYTSADGFDVYADPNGNLWYFANGYYPYRWYGNDRGSYIVSGVPNRTYYFDFMTSNGTNIYRDDYGNRWWFDNSGAHLYSSGYAPAPTPTVNPSGKPAETNVDWSKTATMWVDGKTDVKYVGQYWQAPTTVSWTPAGMRLIGWDYAESTGYARWKPGQWIKNTGSNLALYAVYGK